MAQVWSPKILFFCFFFGATAENVYPKLCITSLCGLLCETKKCAHCGHGINLSDAVIKAHRINITAISLKESITS